MNKPLTGTFMAPIERLAQSSGDWSSRVLGGVGAAVQLIWSDFFMIAVTAVFISHMYDWFYGRQIAKIVDGGKHFDEEISRLGLHSKMASFVIIFLVRAMEAALATQGLADTKGFLAAGIAIVYVVQDIRSIEQKKLETTGTKAIPVLSLVLDGIESVVNRAIPAPIPKEEPKDG